MKLSVIMPCFNVEKTLSRALKSVLMQKHDFDYEMIMINDASTDNTLKIIEDFADKFEFYHVLNNEVNLGNAKSFYRGLTASSGDYFCVLDGDDYYTINDKFQRQVDFLDNDISEEYVATATHYLIDFENGKVNIPYHFKVKEFSYVDFLKSSAGYYHTTTYMYRNIFRNHVPLFFNEELYRGDTPRTTFHLMFSGKKVKVLDFVGSAYCFNYNGIWSSLKEKKQLEYQINYLENHKKNVFTKFETDALDLMLTHYKKSLADLKGNDTRKYDQMPYDDCLMAIRKETKKLSFKEGFVFSKVYYSDYLDSLSSSIGYVSRNNYENEQTINTDSICIVNGVISPRGGGIIEEIRDLIRFFSDRKVFLFVTDMDKITDSVIAESGLNRFDNLSIIFPKTENDVKNKLAFFNREMNMISPMRVYCFCSHTDVYGTAIINQQFDNVVLFSFDHGFLCGLANPNIDTFVAKRPVDYCLLKKKFGKKVKYIPTWDNNISSNYIKYSPYNDHDKLITASGAARYYKCEGTEALNYVDCIVALLKRTDGIHYHFGDIPEKAKTNIYEKLGKEGLPKERFIIIGWTDDLPRELIERHIDLFIEPFPIVSYKLTLKVLSAGVPIIAYDGINRMSITDFIPKICPKWYGNKDNFVDTVLSLSRESFVQISKAEAEYYSCNHSDQVIMEYVKNNEGFCIPEEYRFTDNGILEIQDNLKLYGDNYQIIISNVDGQKEIDALYSSWTYKIGFGITWIPRKIKLFIKNVQSDGLIEALNRPKQFQSFPENCDAETKIKIIKGSSSFFIGKTVLLPFKAIRFSYRKMKEYLRRE